MAKSDSFFIRAKVSTNGTTFAQASVDLGAYVDALGKSVLRIRNAAVQYGSPLDAISGSANSTTISAFQLTTQSQSDMVDASDKSLICSGKLVSGFGAATELTTLNDSLDVAPQHFTNGYLVGVEQIYLGVDQTADRIDQVTIVLECTVETLSQNAAMALALSQQ